MVKWFFVSVICVVALWVWTVRADAAVTKEWTFLVYLDGDNNLDSFGTTNMNQMQAVGSTNDVNIVVLRDRANQSTSAKIYYVKKGSSQMVFDHRKNLDMGDWKTLVDFFKWAQINYPAKHYVVDVWDHGGGWGKKPIVRDIAWDDGTGNAITTPQLGQAMAEMKALNGGKNIDILGMDACLMQMAEVINEVSPSVDVVAASEEVEPGEGWDYNAPLAYITRNPLASALEFASQIEDAYVKFNGSQAVQGSVVSTSALTAAAPKIAELADELGKFDVLSRTQIAQIISDTHAFYMSDFCDFVDFAHRVGEAAVLNPELKAKAEAVEALLKAAVYANYRSSSMAEGAQGVSIWLPSSSQLAARKAKYQAMTWNQTSRWLDFLEKLYQ
jgi:hypothetical protein